VGHLCAHWRTIPAHLRLPARCLWVSRLFPVIWRFPPPPPVAAVGLWLVLVVVVAPVTCVTISGVPDVRVGALEPPSARAWRRAASAASHRSPLDQGGQGCLVGLVGTSWVSQSRCAGILGAAAALFLWCAPRNILRCRYIRMLVYSSRT
jgi:hypothetical protein